jgi:2-C-methyl-D-erythritol 2,4-cyclodiphosphate synthase
MLLFRYSNLKYIFAQIQYVDNGNLLIGKFMFLRHQFLCYIPIAVICFGISGIEEWIMRIGMGYDIHRLVAGRKLVLGGIVIPFEKGLLGHSDADVLVHAVIDALLGAAGLGDIGQHFPDTAPEFKDISSLKLLSKTYEMISSKGMTVQNIDITIFAEAPKLLRYKAAMKKNIAQAIEIEQDRVNVKAKTFEGLGMVGKGESMAAQCVALLKS